MIYEKLSDIEKVDNFKSEDIFRFKINGHVIDYIFYTKKDIIVKTYFDIYIDNVDKFILYRVGYNSIFQELHFIDKEKYLSKYNSKISFGNISFKEDNYKLVLKELFTLYEKILNK